MMHVPSRKGKQQSEQPHGPKQDETFEIHLLLQTIQTCCLLWLFEAPSVGPEARNATMRDAPPHTEPLPDDMINL